MEKNILKDVVTNSTYGILETTGLLGVVMIVVMLTLVIIGLRKRVVRKINSIC